MHDSLESREEGHKPALDYIFHPETIAFTGVSTELWRNGIANSSITRFQDVGLKGGIYTINPSGGEAIGNKIYLNIRDVPEPVDYVVPAIPTKYTLQLISDCADKGVKLVHMFSAGFSDCSHNTESGCGVRAAIYHGDLDPARLESYRKL